MWKMAKLKSNDDEQNCKADKAHTQQESKGTFQKTSEGLQQTCISSSDSSENVNLPVLDWDLFLQ